MKLRRVIEPTMEGIGPLHSMAIDKLDPEAFIAAHVAAHADPMVYLKGQLGYCYFETKVGTKHPNLKLDFVGECVRLAQGNNLDVIGLYTIGMDDVAFDLHPDWCARDKNGKPIRTDFLGSEEVFGITCWNSGYAQYTFDLVEEALRKYPLGGVWIDIVGSHADCYCDSCQSLYRRQFGSGLPLDSPARLGGGLQDSALQDQATYTPPTESDWSEEWREMVCWRLDNLDGFLAKLAATIQVARPGTVLYRNLFPGRLVLGWDNGGRARPVQGENMLTISGGNYLGQQPLPDRASFACLVGRGIANGRVGSYTVYRGNGYPPQSPASAHRYRLETTQLLTHGAGAIFCGATPAAFDMHLDTTHMHLIGQALAEYAAKAVWLEGAQALPYAAVYFSDATRLYFDPAVAAVRERLGSPIQGALSLLLRLHVPVDVLPDWHATPERLAEFPVLILPNAACLSMEEVTRIRHYAAQGGLVIGTFESGLYDEMGRKFKRGQLADLFGVEYVGRSDGEPNTEYVNKAIFGRYEPGPLFAGLDQEYLWFTGPAVRTRATSGSTLAIQVEPRVTRWRGKQHSNGLLVGGTTQHPLVHHNRYGKGQALFFAAEFFKQTIDVPDRSWWHLQLLDNILRQLAPRPAVRLQAPPTVECSFFSREQRGRRQIIAQMVNRTHRDVALPVRDLTIELDTTLMQPEKIYRPWPTEQLLTGTETNGILRVSVPELSVHDMVIFEARG